MIQQHMMQDLSPVPAPSDGEQEIERRDQDPQSLQKVDDFNKIAAEHVQAMLSKLLAEHQSSVGILQSEISSLRKQIWDSDTKLTQEISQPTPADHKFSREVTGGSFTGVVASSPYVSRNSNVSNEYSPHVSKDAAATPNRNSAEFHVHDSLQHTLQSKVNGTDTSPQKVNAHQVASKMHGSASSAKLEPTSRLQRFVMGQIFEIVTGGVIVINTIVMALEIQYNGYDVGHSISPSRYTQTSIQAWPGAEDFFNFVDLLFNILFLVELLLRFYAFRLRSFRIAWMYFDTTIVILGWVDSLAGESGGIGIDPTMVRLVRLIRIARLLKIFQAMSSFDSLFLLLKSIYASMQALLWSFLLLGFVQVGTSIFLCQMLSNPLTDPEKDLEMRMDLFKYFGTFTRAMLTMFQITLANWVPVCRFLVEEVHEAYTLFFIVYRCLFCFSVLKVIAAVFISETNRVLGSDIELTMMKAQREKAAFLHKLMKVLRSMDDDGSGKVSWQEMEVFLADAEMSLVLATIGFDKTDVQKIFWLIQEDGEVDIENFVMTVDQLRGHAKSVDLQNTFKLMQNIHLKLEQVLEKDEHNLEKLEETNDEVNKILHLEEEILETNIIPKNRKCIVQL